MATYHLRTVLIAAALAGIAGRASACPAGSVEGGKAVLTDFAEPGASDYSPAFACALAALCKDPGGKCGGELWVPKGTFPIRSTVAIVHAVRIVGVGPVSKIVWAGGDKGAMFDLHPAKPVAQDFERLSLTRFADGRDACTTGVAPSADTVGIQVNGARAGLINVSICGLGTAVRSGPAVGGNFRAVYLAGNRIAIQLEKADSWVLDGVTLDRNVTGLLVRSSVGIGVFGLSATATASDAVWLQGCVGCQLEGVHFAENGNDLHLGKYPEMGGASEQVRQISVTAVDGARRVEIVNPRGCPVDRLSFQNFAGSFKPVAPAYLDIDSACPIHASLREAEFAVRSKNTFDGTGPPEVIAFEATGFAASNGETPTGIGVNGGLFVGSAPDGSDLTIQSVTASSQHSEAPEKSFRVLADGRAALGGSMSDATLTLTQTPGRAALDLAGEYSSALRWRDPQGQLGAAITSTAESTAKGAAMGMGISTAQRNGGYIERVHIDGEGRVGIGTNKPTAALQVAGSLRVRGNLKAKSVVVPTGTGAKFCSTGGTFEIAAATTPDGSDVLRICDGGAGHVAKLEELPAGSAP